MTKKKCAKIELLGLKRLWSVFCLLKDHVSHSTRHALTKFEEIMVFLMGPRLGYQLQDLAYRFGVFQSTISRICNRWLEAFSDRLQRLLLWPEKDEIMKTMPVTFVGSFDCRVQVILDFFFRIFIDRLSSYLTRAETWSNDKHVSQYCRVSVGNIAPRCSHLPFTSIQRTICEKRIGASMLH